MSTPDPRLRLVVAVALFALVSRLSVSAISFGTNDVTTWLDFGRSIHANGLAQSYRAMPKLNHPPLAAYWAAAAYSISAAQPHWFAFVFRLPAIFADVGSCIVLALIWKNRAANARPSIAALAMALNLDAFLISAYHGNTDNVYAFLALLAVYLMNDLRQPFLAGAALAAAINVKLIPVVLIVPMLAMCRSWRDAAGYVAGLVLGAVPFVIALIVTGEAFYHNALTYTSDPNRWGIIYALRVLRNLPHMHSVGTTLLDGYHILGRFIVIAASAALAILYRRRGARDGYELAAMVVVAMLVLAPGFAVQYTVAAAPLLLAVSLRWGTIYGIASGAFVLVTYIVYATTFWPPRSEFTGLIPHSAAAVGVAVWMLLVWMLVRLIHHSAAAPRM